MNRAPSALAAAAGLVAFTVLFPAPGARSQDRPREERKAKNLKVLPADIPHDQLVSIMRNFSRSLGVHCDYCHVVKQGEKGPELDFPADDKETKKTARLMLKMTSAVNADWISKVGTAPAKTVSVRCMTCHRGLPEPVLTPDVLADSLAAGGPDSAVAAYKELRSKYYGTGSYDFGEDMLVSFAQDLAGKDKPDAALRMLELNLQYFPESGETYQVLGMVYAGMGKKDEAVAALEKAVQLEPDNRRLRMMLERVQGGN
jgi:hypothetical protein